MSTPAQLAANLANAQASTGPRTEEGKAASSKNATKHGLFATHDFIRPGEEPLYAELDDSLRLDLAPSGILEHNLVDEIRRAMWRLRRCGQVEESFIATLDGDAQPDPMQNEADAKIQNSVDRARAQSHRLLHKCTAELRKLQTERHFRNEHFEAGADISNLGLCDLRAVRKGIDQQVAASLRQHKLDEINTLNQIFQDNDKRVAAVPMAPAQTPETPVTGERTGCDARPQRSGQQQPEPGGAAGSCAVTKETQTPRNAPCPCKSGEKYKRCCGKNAPPVLNNPGCPVSTSPAASRRAA